MEYFMERVGLGFEKYMCYG